MQEDKVLAIILSGGRGTRLYPLTKERCKPAISFGGKYRLIDIPISNCLHSGVNQIFVLTQFLTASIHRHLFQTYRLDMLSKGFIEILPAEQTHTGEAWYQGTADAVRHSIRYIQNHYIEDVLILSGDQICIMDFAPMLEFHRAHQGSLTVIGSRIPRAEAHRMGIMRANEEGMIEEFLEKPKGDARILPFEDGAGNVLASTGNYIFKRDALLDLLEEFEGQDFGKEIIPATIQKDKAYLYPFMGYWEDIGTIQAFYQANLELASASPQLDLYSEEKPIFTHARFLPAAKLQRSEISSSLVSEGSMIEETRIENSLIGLRSVIKAKCVIRKSILLGNDFYQRQFGKQVVTPEIEENVLIERAIIDKNVRIGRDTRIVGREGAPDADHELYCVRDGIVVVPKGVTIPAGTLIMP